MQPMIPPNQNLAPEEVAIHTPDEDDTLARPRFPLGGVLALLGIILVISALVLLYSPSEPVSTSPVTTTVVVPAS